MHVCKWFYHNVCIMVITVVCIITAASFLCGLFQETYAVMRPSGPHYYGIPSFRSITTGVVYV